MIELRWLQPEPQDEPAFMALLDDAERSRARRFHVAEDRLSYAAAHALLRTMLSDVAEGAPEDWRFIRAPSGKPRLDGRAGSPDLRFSLSHARGVVACGVATAIELGVDVEPIAPVADAMELARAHFSAREADGLQAMAQGARSEAFLQLWTLKEAYLKATGEGLGRRTDEPEFALPRLVGADETRLFVSGRKWDLRRFPRQGCFALSLAFPALDGGPPTVHCRGTEVRDAGLRPVA